MEISQEIIDNVIAAVGDDTQLLKQCTLVSSSFLRPSRKQLFSKISLKSDQNCKGIHQVLIENPVIQSFVKTITVVYSWDAEASTWMKTSKSLLAILRLPFSCLECLSIVVRRNYWNRYPWTWNSFNKELKDALANIVHISTLKTLTLNGIVKAPSSFFSNIDHLTTLELYSITPYDFVVDENSNSSSKKKKKKASKEVVPMASQTVIDRCVWYYWDEHERDPAKSYFLPFVCRVRVLEIYIELGSRPMYDFDILSIFMGSVCISLTSPAALEHLELNIQLRGDITYFEQFYEKLRGTDAWSHLDSLTTNPASSQLQRVGININNSFRSGVDVEKPHDDEILKTILDSLPLLRAKGILYPSIRQSHFEGLGMLWKNPSDTWPAADWR